MEIDKFISDYTRFFSKVAHVDSDGSFKDTIKMHPVEAVGMMENPEHNLEDLVKLPVEKVRLISKRMLNESKIKNAFFYYSLANFMEGKSIFESADEVQNEWSIAGVYSIAKIHEPSESKKTAIFLDWDDTSEVKNKLRHGFTDFVKYFRSKSGERKYSVIVTSATFDWGGRVKKYDTAEKKFQEMFDAAYTVPIMANLSRFQKGKDSSLRMGKLYTDICKKLDFNPYYSVIITDAVFDMSVDYYFPIVTLVTNGHDTAKDWEKCIEYLEELGKGNILAGARAMKKHPVDIHDEDVFEFLVSKGLKLYSHPLFRHAYFINTLPQKKNVAHFL